MTRETGAKSGAGPETRQCGACCGTGGSSGYRCIHCGGYGSVEQKPYECKHFVDEWHDCIECMLDDLRKYVDMGHQGMCASFAPGRDCDCILRDLKQ